MQNKTKNFKGRATTSFRYLICTNVPTVTCVKLDNYCLINTQLNKQKQGPMIAKRFATRRRSKDFFYNKVQDGEISLVYLEVADYLSILIKFVVKIV